jgi:signal peptidase II
MRNPLGPWQLAVILLLVIADWTSKALILSRIPLGEAVAVIDGWLYFAHRQNPGVAFSMLAAIPEPWGRIFLSALSIGVVILLLRFVAETPDRVVRGASVLVIAGAIGNVGDRLVTGSVTDFIYVVFFPYVFNVADSAITVGGIALGLRLLLGGSEAKQEASAS